MSLRADIEAAHDVTPATKISKREAGYKIGLPQAHCGICKHFEAPQACEIVKGQVAPDMWCRYFERKKGSSK